MSGVEDVQKDPPDPHIKEEEDESDPEKEEVTQPVDPVPVRDSSEASSLTGSWTLLEKEEEDAKNVCYWPFWYGYQCILFQKAESDNGSASGSSVEVLDQNDIRDRPEGK